MRDILKFLFILFLEISCGIMLAFLYWLVSYLLFDNEGFGRSRSNEAIYYIVILLPPTIYCWTAYLRFKKRDEKSKSVIYLAACITYFVGSLIFMLRLTNFYLLGN